MCEDGKLINKKNLMAMLNAFLIKQTEKLKEKDNKEHKFEIEGMHILSVFPIIIDDKIIVAIPGIKEKNQNTGTMYFCILDGAFEFEIKEGKNND